MSIHHRKIPLIPERPRIHPISGHISRSYPVGRKSFSRACQGEDLTLTITAENLIPGNVQAKLVTTLNSDDGKEWNSLPFKCIDKHTLICHVTSRYPGLHSFHAEFSLDNGKSWLRDTVPDAWVLIDPPQVDGLRLYTLIPNVSGTVVEWKADLKRIRDLGFNAVHLLPLTTLDSSESPYAAKDLFDIDKKYLEEGSALNGLSQLEEYIEEARLLNIRLCFDLVLNHVGVHSIMANRAPDWIVPDPDQADGLQRARYWTNQGWCFWDDLVLINYEHPSEAIRSEIRAYMTDYTLFWAKYANDTGGFVRFDNLHSSDPDFVQALTTALQTEFPNLGILAEYFTDETTLLHTGPLWGLNLNLATPWDYKFVPQLREYLNYIHRVSKHVRYFMPVTSHDSGSPAQEFGSKESIVPRYVAAALLGTGATGIVQGVEYGESERINFIGRNPKFNFNREARFAKFISRVNSIIKDYSAFRHGENCEFVDNGHDAIIAAFRKDNGMQALGFLVICNFDIYNSQQIVVNLSPYLGSKGPFQCAELLSGERTIIEQSNFELMLQPSDAKILMFPKGKK
jgi:hypothetical protein